MMNQHDFKLLKKLSDKLQDSGWALVRMFELMSKSGEAVHIHFDKVRYWEDIRLHSVFTDYQTEDEIKKKFKI